MPPHQREQQKQAGSEGADGKNPAVQLMKDFLARRYDPANKLLNLSDITGDKEVLEAGMFKSEATQKKFFPALMIVCEDMLETQEAKEAAIESVTLSNNNLQNLNAVYKLCWQLNHIKNLDISNNAFASIDALRPWKQRFKNLEHLIVDPFPSAGWEEELTSWFPKLRILNGTQVRGVETDDDLTAQDVPAVPTQAAVVPVVPVVTAETPAVPVATENISPEEAQRRQEMLLYVQQETNLTQEYAIQCLEASGWNIEEAAALFTKTQATLPPEAFNN